MKKISFILLICFQHVAWGQASFAGNHQFEVYAGGPNMMRYDLLGNNSTPSSNAVTSGLAPSGFRYHYFVSNDVSIGLDLIYTSFKQSYQGVDTVFDAVNGQYNYVNASIIEQKSRLRIHARFNFMLATSSPNIDSYIGLGVGTNDRWQKRWVNGKLTEDYTSKDLVIIPVSARVCYGFRYFFNYNSALGAEVGIGGPLFSFQYTYKF